jgi:hypothetical protein
MTSPRYHRDKAYDAKRRQHPDYHFWRSREWRDRIRVRQLTREPFCAWCALQGIATPATQCDHIIRPMGDARLQRDPANLRSMWPRAMQKRPATIIAAIARPSIMTAIRSTRTI